MNNLERIKKYIRGNGVSWVIKFKEIEKLAEEKKMAIKVFTAQNSLFFVCYSADMPEPKRLNSASILLVSSCSMSEVQIIDCIRKLKEKINAMIADQPQFKLWFKTNRT